jgi:hypothetical protein
MGCRSSWELLGVQLLLQLLPVHHKATATRGDTAASIVRSISSTAEARLSWPTSLLKGVTDCPVAVHNCHGVVAHIPIRHGLATRTNAAAHRPRRVDLIGSFTCHPSPGYFEWPLSAATAHQQYRMQ